MEVYKFGGASVKNAEAIKNVGEIINAFKGDKLLVVISAMGKVTNQLEALFEAYLKKDANLIDLFEQLKSEHLSITNGLGIKDKWGLNKIKEIFNILEDQFHTNPASNQDFLYDQIVSKGEMLSTLIVSSFLRDQGMENDWLNVKRCIKTNNNYREGIVDWALTQDCIERIVQKSKTNLIVTQGFLGATPENFTTTLGREGSDYTGAIFAHCLEANKYSIWKDVPGVLNGDPRFVNNTQKIEQLSFQQANAMTFYGAKVIHPKTLTPLQQKLIPLEVRSFLKPNQAGTLISAHEVDIEKLPPVIISKKRQTKVRIVRKDELPMNELDLAEIYSAFGKQYLEINLVKSYAFYVDLCVDDKDYKINPIQKELADQFQLNFTKGNFESITFLNYNYDFIKTNLAGKRILLESKSEDLYKVFVECL